MGKTVTIFGRQVPVVALVGIAGVLGVVLVMRARSKGTNVVSAGTTAAAAAAATNVAAANTTYDPNLQGLVSSGTPFAGTPDYGSQLAYIQAQLTALTSPAAVPIAPAPPSSSVGPDGIVIPSGNKAQDILTQLQASLGRTSPGLLQTWENQANNNEIAALHAIAASPEAQAYAAGQWAAAHPPAGAAATTTRSPLHAA